MGGHSRPPLKIPVPKTWVNLGLAGDSITSIDGAVSREIGDTMTAVTDHHSSHWRFRRCRTGQQRWRPDSRLPRRLAGLNGSTTASTHTRYAKYTQKTPA